MRDRALGIVLLTLLAALPAGAQTGSVPPPARQKELIYMVRQDCGSCHGLSLAGGLGSPLRPGDLAGKPVEYLKTVILKGRPGTAMPPWEPLLTEAEAAWIARSLVEGLPDAR